MRLLDEIVEAHGGLDAWRGTDRVRLRARSGGLLLRTRAPGDSFADARVEVGIGSVHASAAPFPGPGRRGVYADGAVRIETDAGEVVESRRNPRPCFFGRAGIRRNFRWDELDLVYFAGYAWWNYLNHPLLLTREDVAVVEAEPMRRDGQTWRRLDVTFPAGLDTHSAKQSFFYDRDLRLRRHDYVAEVVGRWAHAAHMCGDHREVGGLLVPTRRRVYPVALGGHPLPGPVLVALDISEIEVVPREPPARRPPP
jgi:hypothetical protein